MNDLAHKLIDVDALDFDKLERDDDEGLGGSENGTEDSEAWGPSSSI